MFHNFGPKVFAIVSFHDNSVSFKSIDELSQSISHQAMIIRNSMFYFFVCPCYNYRSPGIRSLIKTVVPLAGSLFIEMSAPIRRALLYMLFNPTPLEDAVDPRFSVT